ncbi:DNA mismatch repair protein MutS [Vagococcus bubulae]|uniref:DNA mismatch repair protein MutS n=1 Tax=Vagococcus bubulae TaxID=1977868 RepID=A0A429ZA93_9ENTE|nr:DNA mismatch repair protein MutS [Vagococcus bubulae]RST90637.1 DNA mismatch repair protein MutS [Vagococcus bubulae]
MPQKTKHTPMMEQYFEIKAQYPDAFLFYRLGDFYEMFYEDAEKVSQLLELTLTSRNKNAENPIPMCGVPHHSAANYIDILVEKGYKVAICEQVEDPKTTKGMVKREVVQLVTPGTALGKQETDAKQNNFLTAIVYDEVSGHYGFSYTDLSTGEMNVATLLDEETVQNECSGLRTKEIVIGSELPHSLLEWFESQSIVQSPQTIGEIESEFSYLMEKVEDKLAKLSTQILLTYLSNTQKRQLSHLQQAQVYEPSHFLKMDYYSKYNLELTQSIRSKDKKGTLLWLLDETQTAMGGRLLKQWIDRPLLKLSAIKERQEMVESLTQAYFERMDLKEYLRHVYDLERLAGRVAFGTVNGRDLLQLKQSLEQIPMIQNIIQGLDNGQFGTLLEQITPMDDLVEIISESINEEAPLSITEGNVIKDGFNDELDKYRDAMKNGKQWLAEMEAKERQATGIKTLKIKFNRVFGYFIEVTKSNIQDVPVDRYERKQTLANAERYITPELKEMETLILESQEKSQELEYRLFLEVRETVKESIERLQSLAKAVATLDILQGFAEISETYQYVRPEMTTNQSIIQVDNGRHPVVEKVLGSQEYVPNSIEMDKDTMILLITGPNMSGKSTYMRQLALTVIMAQIGCFVPAEKAVLPIFDQIFTRIGASDDLISGQSTFMVEMMEANQALRYATPNSLILFDELGRGTATYDGMALAQAIIEYIHEYVGAKTLFSTHYHEITTLEDELQGVSNRHVGAVEENGEVVFLHKMMEGPADKSYGIHVAKLAGLPTNLLHRASDLLENFESQAVHTTEVSDAHLVFEKEITSTEDVVQLSLFSEETPESVEVVNDIKNLNLLSVTPLEALNILSELQKKVQ